MGWIILLALAAAAFGLLWRYGRLSRQTLELTAAALFLAVAGYTWQGSPGQAGTPVVSRETAGKIDLAAIAARKAMGGQFGTEAQWLDFAEALNRIGQTQSAVTAIRSGLRENPRSADLWVGLGNALVAHADGLITPAAQFAFNRAAQISPEHPGPPFFYGLALAQSGKVDEAGDVWRGLLARTPKDAPWRADLEARLAAIGGQFATPAPPTNRLP